MNRANLGNTALQHLNPSDPSDPMLREIRDVLRSEPDRKKRRELVEKKLNDGDLRFLAAAGSAPDDIVSVNFLRDLSYNYSCSQNPDLKAAFDDNQLIYNYRGLNYKAGADELGKVNLAIDTSQGYSGSSLPTDSVLTYGWKDMYWDGKTWQIQNYWRGSDIPNKDDEFISAMRFAYYYSKPDVYPLPTGLDYPLTPPEKNLLFFGNTILGFFFFFGVPPPAINPKNLFCLSVNFLPFARPSLSIFIAFDLLITFAIVNN